MILDVVESRPVWRTYLFSLVILTGLLSLVMALAYRQLLQGYYWQEQMLRGSTRVVKLPAPRGNILDRNGVVLVDNRPSYNVALYLDEFGAGRNRKKLLVSVSNCVETLKQRMKMPVAVNENKVLRHYQLRGPLPLSVWNDLSPAAMAAFEERSPWMKGVDRQIEPVRFYPFGTLASHVLGYVGKPETSDQEQEFDFSTGGRRAYSQPNVIGKSGIEASMDKELQGVQGQRVIKLNAAGLKEDEFDDVPPMPGNNVVLSIDQEMQAVVEQAFTGYRGACVLLNPRDGDVLAMASVPAYDPNLFVPAIKAADWKALLDDAQEPMLNRAIQGTYNPGSTFKVIAALVGLESGRIRPETNFECTGHFYLGPIEFDCWEKGGHGDMGLREAITQSCNVYFYNLGTQLGGPPLWQMATVFGLGQKSGIPLDESPGLLGTDAWKRKHRPREGGWTAGDSANMVIGQGFLNVTPLQMAVVAATCANGGTVYKPRLVLRMDAPGGKMVKEFQPQVFGCLPALPENIQFVRKAMLNVVEGEHGTGKSTAQEKVKVAAKTGSGQFSTRDPETGELVKQTRAWMISFAPFDQPRYAMAIIAEGGESGGRTAGPIVGAIYKKLFQLERERKKSKRPPSVPAVPVSEKIEGVEGEISGKFSEENEAPADSGMLPEEEIEPLSASTPIEGDDSSSQ